MADTNVGGRCALGLRFGLSPERPSFSADVDRATRRPACSQANAIDASILTGAPQ